MITYKSVENKLLAIVDDVQNFKSGLGFYGSKDDLIQVAKFRYDHGKLMKDHKHITRERLIEKTQEVLIVFKGSCNYRIFDESDTLFVSGVLKSGQFLISYWGGVGYTVLEDDSIMMEVKLGPYDVKDDLEDKVLINKEV